MVHGSVSRLSKNILVCLGGSGASLIALCLPDLGYFLADFVVQLFVHFSSVTERKKDLQVNEEWGKNHSSEKIVEQGGSAFLGQAVAQELGYPAYYMQDYGLCDVGRSPGVCSGGQQGQNHLRGIEQSGKGLKREIIREVESSLDCRPVQFKGQVF